MEDAKGQNIIMSLCRINFIFSMTTEFNMQTVTEFCPARITYYAVYTYMKCSR